MNVNLSALRDSLPISVDSNPRCGHSASNNNNNNNSNKLATDADSIMPDLVSDGGGGGLGATVPKPRTIQQDWKDDDAEEGPMMENKDVQSQAHLNHISQTGTLVDSFNQVYQRQINYYDQNFEPLEAMRVSVKLLFRIRNVLI